MSRGLFLVNQTFLSPETNFALVPGKYILGRSASCHLVVPDSTVSRRHCEITVADSSVTLNDLDSRHGTFVEGVKVRSSNVREGQQVRFGRVVFLLAPENSPQRQIDLEDETDDPRRVRKLTAFEEAAAVLSPAQRRVLRGLLRGDSEKQVAHELGVSPHTVHNHIRAIYRALKVHARSELLTLLLSGADE